ncbi:MAG: hypothetical protein QG670_2548 [Thermoproteota archaeon]|nr:hypothetical protein [Thermoproteota archaeon]
MNKMFNIIVEHLNIEDEIECAFPCQHEGALGYIILSKKRMFFIKEDLLTRGIEQVFFEIPLWAISSIEEGEYSFITIVNDREKYSFESIFSSEVKAEFEKLKGEKKNSQQSYSQYPLFNNKDTGDALIQSISSAYAGNTCKCNDYL